MTFADDHYRSIWNGHIHSDTKVTIDAASSYLQINGSISAPEIYATSIKGRALPGCRSLGFYIENKVNDPLLSPLLTFLLGKKLSKEVNNIYSAKEIKAMI